MSENKQNSQESSAWRSLSEDLSGQHLDIIMYPSDLGKPTIGTAEGPEYMMKHGLELYFQQTPFKVNKLLGNKGVDEKFREPTAATKPVGRARNQDGVIFAGRNSAKRVERSLAEGHKVLSLRGDHSGLHDVAGALRATKGDMGMVYIDTHLDLHNTDSSESKNAHGMPLRTLLGDGGELNKIMHKTPHLRGENLVIVGIRQPDKAEVEYLRLHPEIRVFTIQDIKEKGWGPVYAAIDEVQSRVPMWLDMDVDALKNSATPMKGGALDATDVEEIALRLGSNAQKEGMKKVLGVGIAEFLPPDEWADAKEREEQTDRAKKTVAIVKGVASRALGAGIPEVNEYDDTTPVGAAQNKTKNRLKKTGWFTAAATVGAMAVGAVTSYWQKPSTTPDKTVTVAAAKMNTLIYDKLNNSFRKHIQALNDPRFADAALQDAIQDVREVRELASSESSKHAIGEYVLGIISQELESTKWTETLNKIRNETMLDS